MAQYSPDFDPNDLNPIEKAISKRKTVFRKAGEGKVAGQWDCIGKLVVLIEPQEAQAGVCKTARQIKAPRV
jgi:hypothetical protein